MKLHLPSPNLLAFGALCALVPAGPLAAQTALMPVANSSLAASSPADGGASARAAVREPDTVQLLASELPPGVTLRVASLEQVTAAFRKAVSREPQRAVGLVRAAILSKSPRRPVEGKNVVDRSKETLCPPCDFILGVVRFAIQANPAKASAIVEEANSLCAACGADLQSLLSDPSLALDDPDGFLRNDTVGFGVGFGPGFPGSPSGGPTGGNFGGLQSLPPLLNLVTDVTKPIKWV